MYKDLESLDLSQLTLFLCFSISSSIKIGLTVNSISADPCENQMRQWMHKCFVILFVVIKTEYS